MDTCDSIRNTAFKGLTFPQWWFIYIYFYICSHILYSLEEEKLKKGNWPSVFNNLYLHPCYPYLNMLLYHLNATPCKKYKHLLFHRIANGLFIHRVSFPLLQLLSNSFLITLFFAKISSCCNSTTWKYDVNFLISSLMTLSEVNLG